MDECVFMWLRGKDSNQRPPGYELPQILFTTSHGLRKLLISCGFSVLCLSLFLTASDDLAHACALNVRQKLLQFLHPERELTSLDDQLTVDILGHFYEAVVVVEEVGLITVG